MSSAKYCYQCPTLLGSGYQVTKKNELIGYEYKILIEGSQKGFKIISPSYLGEIPRFSIKKPEVVKRKEGNHTKVSRKKIITLTSCKSKTPENEIQLIEKINKVMWNYINPNTVHSCNFMKTEVKVEGEKNEELYSKKSYSELKKQYLILPITHKSGPGSELKSEVDIKFCQNLLESKKSSKNINKIYIYKNKTDNKIYIVKEVLVSLKSASCFDFIQALFHNSKGRNYNLENVEDKNMLLDLINGLGLKNVDIKKVKFLDYLYDRAVEANPKFSNNYLHPLRTFVCKHPDRKKVESEMIVFARNAVTGITADLNFYENITNFKTNKMLSKQNLRFENYHLFLTKELINTKIKHSWMDAFAQLPAILINIERFAQIREFKIYNNFLFMKNYSLYKALCSRSYDKVVNNETLETLGDTVLKTIITLNLFKNKTKMNEGGMTRERTKLINNKYLSKRGLERGIQFFLKSEYIPVKKWTPPYFESKDNKKNEDYKEEQILSDKMIADSVEAIIGAAMVSTNRLYEPLQVLKKLRILEEFNFEGYEKFFKTQFNPDLTCLKKLDKLVKPNISYRKLLRLSDSDIFSKFKMRNEMKKRVENIKKKPRGEARNEEHELVMITEKDYFKNYISGILMSYKPTNASSNEDKVDKEIMFKFLQKDIFRSLENRHLGYTFKDKKLRDAGIRPVGIKDETKKKFERLEFLGDAVIEVLTIYIARKIFIHLKKSYTPEMLHAVKVVVLSTEGLSRIFLHLKLHRYLLLGNIPVSTINSIREFMKDYNPFLEFKHLWWQNKISAPKILADIVESLMGAVFLDGGWDALFKVFGRIVTPMVYYCCKYFDLMGTDLIHDIISYFAKRGVKCEFRSNRKSCSVYLFNETGERKILKVDGNRESECKRKAAVKFMTDPKYKSEFDNAQKALGEEFEIFEGGEETK